MTEVTATIVFIFPDSVEQTIADIQEMGLLTAEQEFAEESYVKEFTVKELD